MTTALVSALILLWILVIALSLLVVALLRQVGTLHDRLGPVGALTLPGGPQAGDAVKRYDLIAIDGRQVQFGGQGQSRSTLLFFLSPSCPVCKSLLPVLKSIARDEGNRLQLILASDGEERAQCEMIEREKLQAFPLVLSTPLGLAFEVSKLPHAVLINSDGKVAAKGLVNNREHLESLFEAQSQGVASLQDFRERQARSVRSVNAAGSDIL